MSESSSGPVRGQGSELNDGALDALVPGWRERAAEFLPIRCAHCAHEMLRGEAWPDHDEPKWTFGPLWGQWRWLCVDCWAKAQQQAMPRRAVRAFLEQQPGPEQS